MSVDLPAPFSPSNARICPRRKVREMWLTARVSPKLLQRSRNSTSGETAGWDVWPSERTIGQHFQAHIFSTQPIMALVQASWLVAAVSASISLAERRADFGNIVSRPSANCVRSMAWDLLDCMGGSGRREGKENALSVETKQTQSA
jgi:hypothetical protein